METESPLTDYCIVTTKSTTTTTTATTPTSIDSTTTDTILTPPPTTTTTMTSMMLLLPDDLIANEIFSYVGKGNFYFVALVNKKFYALYKRFLLNDDIINSSNSHSSCNRHGTTSYITTFRSCAESIPKCHLFFKECYLRKRRLVGGCCGVLHNNTKVNNNKFRGCSMMWNYDKCCYELLKITASSGNTYVFQYLLRKLIGRSKIQKLLKNLRWHLQMGGGTTTTTTTHHHHSNNNNTIISHNGGNNINGNNNTSSNGESRTRRKVLLPIIIKSQPYYHHIIDKHVFESAVKNGNIQILKIAQQVTKIPFNNMYTKQMMAPLYQPCYPCNIAVTHSQLDILQWLHGPDNDCNVDEWTFQLATKSGNIEILEYLFTSSASADNNVNNWSKVKWNEIYNKVLEGAAYYGHINVMELLKHNKQPIKYQWNDNAIQKSIQIAQSQNQLDALNWLQMQR